MTSWRLWAANLVQRTADAMKAIRHTGDLTAADLSAGTAVGKPLSRAVISDLETGRKKTLDISELLTIAAALGVPPLRLLFPNVLDDVEILPGVTVSGTEALGWFTGLGHLGDPMKLDEQMKIAIQLIAVGQTLRAGQEAIATRERLVELEESGVGLASEATKALGRKELDHYMSQVELMTEERERLVAKYRDALDGRGSGDA